MKRTDEFSEISKRQIINDTLKNGPDAVDNPQKPSGIDYDNFEYGNLRLVSDDTVKEVGAMAVGAEEVLAADELEQSAELEKSKSNHPAAGRRFKQLRQPITTTPVVRHENVVPLHRAPSVRNRPDFNTTPPDQGA